MGRLFAVEEHSNERTGTSAVSGASSSGSHAAGGFKKGKQHKFYICYQYFQFYGFQGYALTKLFSSTNVRYL